MLTVYTKVVNQGLNKQNHSKKLLINALSVIIAAPLQLAFAYIILYIREWFVCVYIYK